VDAIDQLAEWLTKKSRAALDLADDGKLAEANALILAATKEARPQREALSKVSRQLIGLKNDFVALSGAV
jgi:hypothetical protein